MRTRSRPTATVLTAFAALVLAPDRGANATPTEPPQAPQRLDETGLFTPGTRTLAPEVLPFSPQYPLWSDGAAKARWIRLPPGAAIDASDPTAWRFPIGTRLWKEFSFSGRRVETRMSWRATEDDWVFASYVWSDDGTAATLAPPEGVTTLVELAPGRHHAIPGANDCLACHDAGPSPVLGFNALQLSDDRDPLAPHAEPLPPGALTLSRLAARGLVAPVPAALVATPPRIAASTPRERAVLGYLGANCGGCHNERGPLATLGLVLAVAPADQHGSQRVLDTMVDVPGRYLVPGVPPAESRRLAPALPTHSAVLTRMRSRWPASQMPPLGTVLPDAEALALVEGWIREDLRPTPRRPAASTAAIRPPPPPAAPGGTP